MKYYSNQKLWYVNPFVFEIDKITIDMGYIGDDGFIYYIDSETGAELSENDLFSNILVATNHCNTLLDKFYKDRMDMIGLLLTRNIKEAEENL